MLATICIGSHGESKLPSPFNSRSVEAVPFQTIRSGEDISFIEQRFNNVAIKRTQPIELLPPFNSPPLEAVPFQTGGLTKYPSVIPHQPFEPPLNFNYTDVHTDVHNVIKRAALQADQKAVIDGLQSGQSLDATKSLAYIKPKRTQPIELLRPFNSPPLEEVPFQTGGLTKYPSVIPHQPFEPPLNFNYTDVHTDVHNVIKRAALQAAKKAVTDGLQSGQSLDATESLAYQKALKSAKVTNKRFGNLLQDTEISAIASTATQHALKQNNSNTQQGYRTAI